MQSTAGKKFPYVVILKNVTDRPFTVLAVLLTFTSLAFFIHGYFFTGPLDTEGIVLRIFALGVLLALLGWQYVKVRIGEKPKFDRVYLMTALLWLQMPYMQWLIFPFTALALLEHQVKFPLEIGFSETQIVFNTLFRKKYKWDQLSNVMLKDGLLTMDFVNNRLLQREVVTDEDEDDAPEEEFNQFCREQLQKKSAKVYGNFR